MPSKTLGLSPDQTQVQETFRRFADEVVAPGAEERDQTSEFPYDLVKPLAETGIFGMVFPESVGGYGGDTVSYLLALEEIARVDQSVGALVAGQVGLTTLPLVTFGTPEQINQWVPRLIAGEVIGGFALTEPGGGSDTKSMRSKAVRQGESWVINGQKQFVSHAGTTMSEFVIATARVEDGHADSGTTIGAFIVETSREGFSVGPPLKKLGWRSSDTRAVYLDDCRVPAENVLGDIDRGLQQFLKTLVFGRLQIATLGVGLVQAALDAATEFAQQREAFGRPIGQFQGVSFKLADMEVSCHAARALSWAAAQLRDASLPFDHAAAIAKLYSSEAATKAATDCVQIFGGSGFMDASLPARLFRDCKVLEIGEGTSEIQRSLIARALLR